MSERRETLLDQIEPVLHAEGPSASMSALAAGAGITKPVLYRHFGDKGGLLTAHAQRVASRLGERITAEVARERTPRSRIRSVIDTYLAQIEADPAAHWFVTERARSTADADRAVAHVVDRVVGAVATVLREELAAAGADIAQAPTLARAAVGAVQLAGDRWLRDGRPAREELATSLTDLLWLGFRGLGGD